MRLGLKRGSLTLLCGLALALGVAPAAQAAFDDPLFVLRPAPPPPPAPPAPPPASVLEGPCGIAVDAGGDLYVSDYYHHAIDRFAATPPMVRPGVPKYPFGYLGQLAAVDPLDGPCALALDSTGRLYVNDFHRDVVRFDAAPSFGTGTVIDAAHPTGLALDQAADTLYVDERTRIAVFDALGAETGAIGAGGSLQDGYGLAVSGFPATQGFLYVPDAGTETVKVYDPTTDTLDPIAVIDGHETPVGHFASLRNAAVAVDDASGEVYLADNLQPEYAERPETVVYVFDASGAYEGRLKIAVENSLPPGLAVDNSATATQGRVYLTSGNTESASIYAYPPGAATSAAVPLARLATPAPEDGDGGTGWSLGAVGTPGSAAAPSATPATGPSAAVSSSAPASAPATARAAPHAKRPRPRKHRARHPRAKRSHRARAKQRHHPRRTRR